jgi:hypothetical protein
LDHGKHFPQLHSWLNGGKQLLDQVNLKGYAHSMKERSKINLYKESLSIFSKHQPFAIPFKKAKK